MSTYQILLIMIWVWGICGLLWISLRSSGKNGGRELSDHEDCPNKCGPMNLFKKPPSILYLLPEDICEKADLDEALETPENMFGYLLGVCPECGFTLISAPAYAYDWDDHKWILRNSDESGDKK